MRALAAICFSLAAALAAPAQAYTPESGTWWNPNESGTGIFIEVQDNFLVAAVFTGDTQGRPVWYTATKFLTGNALFDATLDLTTNVQCPGCVYPGRPTTQAGAGGSIRLTFDPNDPTKATLRWGNGRTVAYERYAFYAKRPEDPASIPLEATKMLGEWQYLLDFSSNANSAFDYYGDVLVFDDYSFRTASNRWYFEGCRADNSRVGGCSSNALSFHSAAGYFDPGSGLHAIVVDDTTSNYVLYLADMGTNSAEGEVTVYPKGGNPANFTAYPMRTFRTASRTFVQEGVGPSKALATSAASGQTPGLADRLAAAGIEPAAAGKTATSRFDRAALLPAIQELEARLEAKRAER
jgi:hypothetical protein